MTRERLAKLKHEIKRSEELMHQINVMESLRKYLLAVPDSDTIHEAITKVTSQLGSVFTNGQLRNFMFKALMKEVGDAMDIAEAAFGKIKDDLSHV